MNITYEADKPQQVNKEKVFINGREVGCVMNYYPTYPASSPARFQAQLSIPTIGANIHPGGFGATKEEAISEAFKNAHTMLAEFASWLDNTEVV